MDNSIKDLIGRKVHCVYELRKDWLADSTLRDSTLLTDIIIYTVLEETPNWRENTSPRKGLSIKAKIYTKTGKIFYLDRYTNYLDKEDLITHISSYNLPYELI